MNTQPTPAAGPTGQPTAPPASGGTTTDATTGTTDATSHTEAEILSASPLDLARLLCGAGVLADLRTRHNDTRAQLVTARAALGGPCSDAPAPDLAAARDALRAGIAQAIRPDGIEQRAETVLLQVAFWLLDMQAQVNEVADLYAAAAAAAGASQTKH